MIERDGDTIRLRQNPRAVAAVGGVIIVVGLGAVGLGVLMAIGPLLLGLSAWVEILAVIFIGFGLFFIVAILRGDKDREVLELDATTLRARRGEEVIGSVSRGVGLVADQLRGGGDKAGHGLRQRLRRAGRQARNVAPEQPVVEAAVRCVSRSHGHPQWGSPLNAATRLRSLLTAATGWSDGDMPPLPDADDATGRTTLTSGGAPYELSVPVGRGSVSPAPLRYVLDLGAAAPDPATRLAAQRAGIDAWVTRLGAGGRPIVSPRALRRGRSPRAASLAHPALVGPVRSVSSSASPSANRRRRCSGAEFLTWLGIVHHPTEPQRIAALKVYVCVEAASGALGRLAERWPTIGRLAGLFPPDLARPFSVSFTERAFMETGAGSERDARAALGVPTTGTTVTLYRPVTPGYEHQALATAAATLGDAGVGDGLRDLGLQRLLWRGPMVLTTRCLLDPGRRRRRRRPHAGGAGGGTSTDGLAGLRFGVDLSAASSPADALPLARQAARVVHGSAGDIDGLVDLVSRHGGPPWEVTWIGVEGTSVAPIDRLSVYLAPCRVR